MKYYDHNGMFKWYKKGYYVCNKCHDEVKAEYRERHFVKHIQSRR
jgi:hypothetical protein